MQAASRPSNEVEIERAELAVELSKRELNRRVQLARKNSEQLLEQYRARLSKPVVIAAGAALGVAVVGGAVALMMRRRRSGWLLPAPSRPSRGGQILKTAGIWLLRRAVAYAVREILEHAPPSSVASAPNQVQG